MAEIVAIGECLIELFSEEPIGTAPGFHKSYAGDTLDVLTMASKLGTSTGYITKLGDDPFADYLLDSWRTEGVDTSAVKVVPGFTGVHFLSILPGGEREFVYYREGTAATTLAPDDLDPEYIAAAEVIHVSAVPQAISPSARATVLWAAQVARERSVTVSFDTNLRMSLWTIEEAREALQEVLPYVDVIFPGHPEESTSLLGLDTEAEVISYFRSRGVKVVAVKSGEAGAWIGTEEGVWRASAVAPKGVLDTAGAGDAFAAGVLHCLVRGLGPEEGLRWGVVAAGLTVAERGALASQPSREEVEHFLGASHIERVE